MIEQFYDLRPEVLALDRKALDLCRAQFAHVEEIRDYNQLKMLRAFTDCGVEARHFWGSSGYGVWDDSRNKLEEVFARCMGAEAALVRSQFMSGTHTLTVALFGLLRTGDTLLAATGRPYDTLEGVIGIGEAGKGCGTLREYGVRYDECPLLPDFTPDYDLIAEKAKTATLTANGIAKAEQARKDADEAKAKYEAQLSTARVDAAKIRDDARAEASHIIADARSRAESDAAQITASAQRSIESQHQQAIVSLKGEVGALATALAGKILGAKLEDNDVQSSMIDSMIDDLGAKK